MFDPVRPELSGCANASPVKNSAGTKAEHHTAANRERDTPQQHDTVDRDLGLPWQVHRPNPIEEAHAHPRQQHAAGAAARREHEVLGEELPHEAKARGAERAPDGQLAFARLRASHHEVRHIDAGHQQHEGDGAGERHQRGPCPSCYRIAQWADRNAQPVARVHAGIPGDKRRGQRVGLGPGKRHRNARREAPDHHGPAVHPGRLEGRGQPDINAFFHAVGRRQIYPQALPRNADHLDVEVVDDEVPTDDVRVAMKSPLPQLVADHDAQDDEAAAVLLADERAAKSQRGAEQRQQIVGRARRGDPFHHALDVDHRVAAFDLGDVRNGATHLP